MAKSSKRPLLRYERDQGGCIWGLISIFDFRHGRSTRKLLSDRRRANRQAVGVGFSRSRLLLTNSDKSCQGIDVGVESETLRVDAGAGKASVKELMEEEMVGERGTRRQNNADDTEPKESTSEGGRGLTKKSRMRTVKAKKSWDDGENAAISSELKNSCHRLSDQINLDSFDLEVLIEELCHQIHQKSTSSVKHEGCDKLGTVENDTHSASEESLIHALKVFVDHKFTNNGKHPKEDGKIHQPEEFMDALQTLSSNREMFFKLLRDPNSALVKMIQDLAQDAKSVARSNFFDEEVNNSRPSEVVSSNPHNFFRRKSKSKEKHPLTDSENCRPTSRIVVLKPGPAAPVNSGLSDLGNEGQTEKIASQFSFTEIKRRLKHAMGKEQRRNLSGSSVDNGGWSSPNRNHFYIEKFARPSVGIKSKDADTSLGNGTEHRLSNLYIEARKHLSDMLSNGNAFEGFSSTESPKTLGRILSVPEFNSPPLCSPGKGKEREALTARTRLSPRNSFHEEQESVTARTRLSPRSSSHEEQELVTARTRLSPRNSFREEQEVATARTRLSPHNSFREEQESATARTTRLSPCNSFNEEQEFVAARTRLSPRNSFHEEQESVTARTRLSPRNGFHVVDEITIDESQSCTAAHGNPDEELEAPNKDAGAMMETLSPTKESSSKDHVEVRETTGAIFPEREAVDLLAEKSRVVTIVDDEYADADESCDAEKSSECMKLDSLEEEEMVSSPLRSSDDSSIIKEGDDTKSTNERTSHPSPVSVLETLLSEDDIRPAAIKFQSGEKISLLQPIHLEERKYFSEEVCIRTSMEDQESIFEYVEAVLLGSGLNWEEFLLRWLCSEDLLEPSLFDEVELFSTRSCQEQKLLFDCTNEVLKEVFERYFCYSPCLSFVKRNIRPIPRAENLISEVWEGVEWHLLVQPPPRTLEQTIRKDLEKDPTWMDLRFDVEGLGFQISKSIFEEMLEDIILNFTNDDENSMKA